MNKIVFIFLILHSIVLTNSNYKEKSAVTEKVEKILLIGAAAVVAYPIIKHAIKSGWGIQLSANRKRGECGITFNNYGNFTPNVEF